MILQQNRPKKLHWRILHAIGMISIMVLNNLEGDLEDLTVFYQFQLEIRKYTKNKLSFLTEDAVMESAYLVLREATKSLLETGKLSSKPFI